MFSSEFCKNFKNTCERLLFETLKWKNPIKVERINVKIKV